ncbi:heterokaryon incompatibility protein-domain-containing protein [Podospora aff. communis PSN243]|uniref:Heterokaryon incompatibility protein-domain-containing protein n=1 Tax=Podospora aff. communis PSN243 TaxID=3040156 RepID=A0AAV9G1N3_9PEZI|nr:heterokaryon incompatibility protein-domain-containing protein [Podospora aff. communis PSN243]
MRLIDTTTLEIVEFIGHELPPYAILSHTWEVDEASFQDAEAGLLRSGETQGIRKVRKACELARNDDLTYCWVDTCCIDKSSSSELTEAINSMFQWYRRAEMCYAYLADLAIDESLEDRLSQCKWFKRGWTLQELIAPGRVNFYDSGWHLRGTKNTLAQQISNITRIEKSVLNGIMALSSVPVCRRMSWAAGRQTTRQEDQAYSLLGIFDVNMPLIYGEGYKAFIRLQEEIIRSVSDLSIFCWTSAWLPSYDYGGFLAQSPDDFASAANIEIAGVGVSSPEFTVTNKGIRITAPLGRAGSGQLVDPHTLVLSLDTNQDGKVVGVYVKHYGGGMYVRERPDILAAESHRLSSRAPPSVRYLAKVFYQDTGDKIWTVMDNAFRFDGDWDTQHYTYVSTSPAVWWDHEHKTFLRDEGRPFAAFHLFKANWDTTMQDKRFIIAFGVSKNGDDEKPWFRVASEHTYPVLLGAALRGDLSHIQRHGPVDWQASSSELLWLERRVPMPLPSAASSSSRLGEPTYQTWHAALSFSLTTETWREHGITHKIYKLTLENTGAMRTE